MRRTGGGVFTVGQRVMAVYEYSDGALQFQDGRVAQVERNKLFVDVGSCVVLWERDKRGLWSRLYPACSLFHWSAKLVRRAEEERQRVLLRTHLVHDTDWKSLSLRTLQKVSRALK